jgi:hypothetical protein
MASRTLYSETSSPMPNGLQFLTQYADRMMQLFGAAIWPLTSVGGTGDVVTATLDPPLVAGLVENMRFAITWATTNTAGMTLAIDGGAAVPILDVAGAAMAAGSAPAGSRALLEYVGGSFRVINQLVVAGQNGPVHTVFTASGTWSKPTGYADDHPVLVRAWGAGGGGGGHATTAGGGGGCNYAEWVFRYADLPSTVSVSIGAGGVGKSGGDGSGGNGGNSTFGSLLEAFGGAGGTSASGGGGGGELAAATGIYGAKVGGGQGGGSSTTIHAATLWGGGGGGDDTGGGSAVFGGGGGGGSFVGSSGGTSKFGGNGGGIGAAGSAPGGGGGAGYYVTGTNGGAGARGQVEVWIL